MTSPCLATLLLAAAVAVPPAPASAQATTARAGKTDAAPLAHRATRKRARAPARTGAAPPIRSAILGSGGEDEATSLERRRRAFFATKPDQGGPERPAPPDAGITLGGSGGISPGMGFKF